MGLTQVTKYCVITVLKVSYTKMPQNKRKEHMRSKIVFFILMDQFSNGN